MDYKLVIALAAAGALAIPASGFAQSDEEKKPELSRPTVSQSDETKKPEQSDETKKPEAAS